MVSSRSLNPGERQAKMNEQVATDMIRWAGQSDWLLEPQQDRSRRTLAKIIDAAVALFCQQGFGGTSLADIAKYSGVSIGSIYARFADKDAILYAVIESYYRTRLTQLDNIVAMPPWKDADLGKLIGLFIEAMFSAFQQDGDMLRVVEHRRLTDPIVAERAAKADKYVLDLFSKRMCAAVPAANRRKLRRRFSYAYYFVRNTLVLTVLLERSPFPTPLAITNASFRQETLRFCELYLDCSHD